MRPIAVLTLLVACGEPDPQWEEREQIDQGQACVEGQTDATARVFVDSGLCLSSSCDRNAKASCEASLEGTTITVTSTFTWEEATGDVDCTADCGLLVAECDIGPLAAGTYTVVLGDDEETVTVPTEEDCSAF